MKTYLSGIVLVIFVLPVLGEFVYSIGLIRPLQLATIFFAQGDPPPACPHPPCDPNLPLPDRILQSQGRVFEEMDRFIENANSRISRFASNMDLRIYPELEELKELESLRHLAGKRQLTNRERERLTELKGKIGIDSLDKKALESYQFLYDRWKTGRTEKLLLNLAGVITLIGIRKDINSKVQISSRNPGASIKYQTLFERSRGLEPVTAKQLTTCIEIMPIGYYYIWAERNGKITSDDNARFYISAVTEIVILAEK